MTDERQRLLKLRDATAAEYAAWDRATERRADAEYAFEKLKDRQDLAAEEQAEFEERGQRMQFAIDVARREEEEAERLRPRYAIVDGMETALEAERVGADDIWFRVSGSSDGLDVVFYVRSLTEANKGLRSVAAFLFAEHAVGERDTLTLLSSRAAEPHAEQ
jgi:hypothetical protein